MRQTMVKLLEVAMDNVNLSRDALCSQEESIC